MDHEYCKLFITIPASQAIQIIALIEITRTVVKCIGLFAAHSYAAFTYFQNHLI